MPETAQGIPLDRVVAVVATLADGREQVGSGYLVGGRIVLTAEHCTRDKLRAGDPQRPLRVYRATDRTSVDVVKVDACPASDVAVLHLAETAPWAAGLSAPGYARVDRMHAGMLAGCQAIGYPEWQRHPQKATRDHAELHGIIYQTDEAESGRLLMREPSIHPGRIDAADDQQGAATPWGGMSGALVFYDGNAIGIVVEHHPRQGDSALRAIAFDTLVRKALTDPDAAQIATALGLPAEEAMPYAASSPVTSGVPTPGDLPVRRQPPPPAPPGTAVPRPQLAAEALSALRDGSSPLVALVGPGGFGKSVLAMQIAAQVDAQAESAGAEAWCPGKTVWLDIGQNPNLASLLSLRLAELTGVAGAGQSPEKLASDLGAVLADRHCLLVLDDVWPPARQGEADVVDVVVSRIGNVPRLVTTRSATLLDDMPGTRLIEVSEMSPDEAADVLAAAVPGLASEQDITLLGEFARRLGYWPLLLHLAGGYLRGRVLRGAALHKALADLADRYERKGVTAFDARDPLKRHDAIAETVEASLGLLRPEEQGRYRDLAVFPAGQPVPFDIIAGWWAPALDRDDTEDLLTSLAKYALLTLDWRTETVRLHDVLGVYLLPRDPEQVAALHRRLVQNWGGPTEQDGYRTRWYAYHLDLAGESDQLYALITPAWQDHVLAVTGALSDVQDDVCRAAAHAGRRHDLPQELRCWLIATSVVEYAETVPGPLLPVFAWLGEVNRALGYATLNQTSQGGFAMTDIVAVLARKDPGQALAVAEKIDDPTFRGRALADVAAVLARTDIDRAVAIADRINDGTSISLARTRALAHVAAVAAGTDVDRALAIADQIDSPDGKADALIGIAVKLAATDLDRALAIAGQFGVSWREDRALSRIAAALADDQPGQALVAARGIGDPAAKAHALTGVAAVLAKTDPGRADELGDEALAACDDIADAAARTEELAGIGAALAGRAGVMASRAMAAADGIDNAEKKAKALIGIAGAVGGTAPDQALAAAALIDDPVAKAMALTGIAAASAAIDPGRCRQLADQVLDIADTVAAPEGKARLQTGLAVALASTSPDRALVIADKIGNPDNARNLDDIVRAMARTDPDKALVIARRIESRWFKAQAIAAVAATLVDTDPSRFGELAAEALAAARRVEPPWYQAWVFDAFATVVAGTDLDLALDAANRIDDSDHKDRVLRNIAVELAERDADLASATADRIGNPVWKAMALGGIAVTLAGRDPDLALETAGRVDAWERAETLAGIAGTLAETDPDRAVAIAEQIDDDPWRKAQALAWVAAALPATEQERAQALVDRALELASHIDIDIPAYRAEALTGIASALAEVDPGRVGVLAGQAAEAADQIDLENRAQALADITTALAGHAPQLVDPVVAAAERIDDHDRKAEALIAIAFALAEAHPGRAGGLISQALDASDNPQLLAASAVALARVDPGRAAPLLDRVLDAADHIAVPVQKEWTLTVIANPLARHDPELAVATAERIANPEYRAQAFAHIGAVLSARNPGRARELTDHAVAAADRVDPGGRGQAFVDIAEILAREDPRLALVATDRTGDPEAMARALTRVATIRADQAISSRAADCDGQITNELLVRLRDVDLAFSKEAWWRLAQLAVILADSAPDRHDLVRAVLSADW